jgi:hypothetical protein
MHNGILQDFEWDCLEPGDFLIVFKNDNSYAYRIYAGYNNLGKHIVFMFEYGEVLEAVVTARYQLIMRYRDML